MLWSGAIFLGRAKAPLNGMICPRNKKCITNMNLMSRPLPIEQGAPKPTEPPERPKPLPPRPPIPLPIPPIPALEKLSVVSFLQ